MTSPCRRRRRAPPVEGCAADAAAGDAQRQWPSLRRVHGRARLRPL